MRHLNIDIETYSSIDIKKAGLYKYVQSPDFQILLFAYSFDGEPVQIVDLAQGEGIPEEVITSLQDPFILKHAYNAPFEWYCLSKFYSTPLSQWRCTMLHGLYCGYTAGLAATAVAIGLPEDKRKMGVGNSLIKTFCTPTKPSKANGQRTRTHPHHEPEKWKLFKQYCIQDVITEMEVGKKLAAFPVPDQEQRLWELDQRVNAFGVSVDLAVIEGALFVDDVIKAELMQEAIQVSGLDNPKSVSQLKKWLAKEIGEEIDNLRKETVAELIETTDDAAKRVLEIRQELAKTSTTKYATMQTTVCEDGRIRGLLQFYGANRTGRWAGRFVQIQNLPRNYIDTLNLARDLVRAKNVEALRLIYGNVPDILSQLIRTAFIPSNGNVLRVADFNAIEARVISWLAGEQWALEVFRTHGKIYEAAAASMFGVPLERIVKGNPEYEELRPKGKVATLALGYQGGPNALIAMDTKKELKEEELPEIVRRWRSANKRIVDLWFALENAVIDVMRTGQPVGVRGLIVARESEYRSQQDFLTIQLPSRRKLYYAKPFLKDNDFGKEALHYWGVDQKTKKWGVMSTYGGRLVENVTQAIARDCLAESLMRLEAVGYATVFHVHDEIVADVDPHFSSLDDMTQIMSEEISWAKGLPLKAAGFEAEFYMKD